MAVLFPRQRTEIVSSMSLLQHSLLLINRHKIVIERVSKQRSIIPNLIILLDFPLYM